MILGSYINGIYFPFYIAVMLPTYLVVGPHSYFALTGPPLSPQQAQDLDAPLVRAVQILFLLAYPFFYALTSYWWAKAYSAKVWVSAVLLLASLVLAALANIYLVPIAQRPFL